MVDQREVGFESGTVTVDLEEYLKLHEENFRLTQENMLLRTVIESIRGITERART